MYASFIKYDFFYFIMMALYTYILFLLLFLDVIFINFSYLASLHGVAESVILILLFSSHKTFCYICFFLESARPYPCHMYQYLYIYW